MTPADPVTPNDLLDLPFPVLCGPSWPGVCFFSTTREGGVSRGDCASFNLGFTTPDDPAHTQANRQRLDACLPSSPVWLEQVHGVTVFDADDETINPQAGRPVADAAVTTQLGRVVSILTADCLPVVIVEAQGRALGVAHAGWRGLAAGVLEATMCALRSRVPNAAGWRAWVGPAISVAHFEVGDDVRAAFNDSFPSAGSAFHALPAPGKWLADLPLLARNSLHALGVSQVSLSGACTFAQHQQFYSYRRSARTGRQATVAWLTR